MTRKVKKRLALCTAAAAVVGLYAWGFSMKSVDYNVSSERFDGSMRIVFISDLHNCFYGGFDQSALIDAVDDAQPDIVFFGGDVVDQWGGTKYALRIMEDVNAKYPCAYSPGNHEEMREDCDDFYAQVEGIGVPVLLGSRADFEINGQKIAVYGAIDDFSEVPHNEGAYLSQLDSCMEQLTPDTYNILLAHQPECIDSYLNGSFDLILSGHAHGGQWRLPVILDQGLYAPDQGLFPDYTAGMYEYGKTTHIIGTGLAKPLRMIFIPRIFNRPELSIIEINR